MLNKKRLGLAGLLLTGAISVLSLSSDPKKITSFEYKSHRPGYEGKTFVYNLWDDNTISQTDNPNVRFAKLGEKWFYDIDNDNKFGDAEKNALKNGNIINMHPEFNKLVNLIKPKEEYIPSSETEKYLIKKLDSLGLDYDSWFNRLRPEDQKVFATFAGGLIDVINNLPNDYKIYSQEKFDRLLETGDVWGTFREIEQNVSNLNPKEYNAVIGGLTNEVKKLDAFLEENADSVDRISYSLRKSPPAFRKALEDLTDVYVSELEPLTVPEKEVPGVAEKPAPKKLEEKVVTPEVKATIKPITTEQQIISLMIGIAPESENWYNASSIKTQEVINQLVSGVANEFDSLPTAYQNIFSLGLEEILAGRGKETLNTARKMFYSQPKSEQKVILSEVNRLNTKLNDFIKINQKESKEIFSAYETWYSQQPTSVQQTITEMNYGLGELGFTLPTLPQKKAEEKPVVVEKAKPVPLETPIPLAPSRITEKEVLNFFSELEPRLDEVYFDKESLKVADEAIDRIVRFYNAQSEKGREIFIKRVEEISDWYKTLSLDEKLGLYDLIIREDY